MLRGASIFLLGALALSVSPTARAAEKPEVERFTAFAVNMSNVGARTAETLDIVIERWSSDAEKERLLAALMEKGPDELLRKLQSIKLRAGYIRSSKSRGYDLQYAREIPGEDGGRRIIIATDRPISFLEARNQPRSFDYRFMLIEMRLDQNDEGEGKLAYAAKITASKDKKTIEIENYASEPVRLTKITKNK